MDYFGMIVSIVKGVTALAEVLKANGHITEDQLQEIKGSANKSDPAWDAEAAEIRARNQP